MFGLAYNGTGQFFQVQKSALAALVLVAVIIMMPVANAQNDSTGIKNAMVVLNGQKDAEIQPALSAGGSPSNIKRLLELEKELLSITVPYASTGEGGQFEIDIPQNSDTSYNVTVFAPGFVTSGTTNISTNRITDNTTILMQPSAIVSGHVIDEQGKPVSGIVVAVENPHSANYDMTMDDGVFVLDTNLKTGMHKIYAFKPGIDTPIMQNIFNNTKFAMLLQNKSPSFLRTQKEGYIMYSSPIEVEQGKITTLNIRLYRSQIISGRVLDANGNPIPDAPVFAFNSNGTMANTAAITDSNGRYILDNDLSVGNYTVIVPALFVKGYAPISSTLQLPLKNSVDLILQKSNTISGRIVDANGNPVKNATVFAISKSLNSDHTALAEFLGEGTAIAKTDEHGFYTMNSGIGEGTYIVTAAFGNVPTSDSIEVQAGDSAANITLNFTETIVANGKVVDSDGKPIENALVMPSFASTVPGVELFSAKTNSNGTFSLIMPLRDNSTRSLFSEISVSADGYNTTNTKANNTYTIVKMERMPFVKVSGQIVAQKSLSPSIETVITRKGTIIFNQAGDASYGIDIQTNSRVLDASFDTLNKRITIELEGTQGGAGRSEFAIPKEILTGPFIVTTDGKEADPNSIKVSENQTYSTIELGHDHGSQEIIIQGTTAIPEFPLSASTTIAAICLATLLIYKRLRYE